LIETPQVRLIQPQRLDWRLIDWAVNQLLAALVVCHLPLALNAQRSSCSVCMPVTGLRATIYRYTSASLRQRLVCLPSSTYEGKS